MPCIANGLTKIAAYFIRILIMYLVKGLGASTVRSLGCLRKYAIPGIVLTMDLSEIL